MAPGSILAGWTTGETVDLHGLALHVQAGDDERAGAMATMLGALPPAAGPAGVVVRFVRRRPRLPTRQPDLESDQLMAWRSPSRWTLFDPSGLAAVATRDSLVIGGTTDDLAVGFRRLLTVGLPCVVAHHDRWLVHAAAIAGPGGAYLVLGESGAGKSTTAYAALSGGWGVLGDDLAVLIPTAAGLDVGAVPRAPMVPPELVPDGPARPVAVTGDPRGRVRLEGECLAAGAVAAAGVLLVHRGVDPHTTAERARGHDVLPRLLESFAGMSDAGLGRRFWPVASALARLPGWDLRLGADPRTRTATTVEALARVAAGRDVDVSR